MMENLNDLRKVVENNEPGFPGLLQNVSGWRGLFDPYCDEWQQSTVAVKANVIRIVLKYIDFNGLVELYKASWENSTKREYILQDLPNAIEKLAKCLPEAAEYMKLKIYHE